MRGNVEGTPLYAWYGSNKQTVFCRPQAKVNRTFKKKEKNKNCQELLQEPTWKLVSDKPRGV